MNARDPRQSRVFRFVRCGYDAGVAELVYAFDEGPEMVERIRFPGAPAVFPARREAVAEALRLLHLVAGVSYYKAGVPAGITKGRSASRTGSKSAASACLRPSAPRSGSPSRLTPPSHSARAVKASSQV